MCFIGLIKNDFNCFWKDVLKIKIIKYKFFQATFALFYYINMATLC